MIGIDEFTGIDKTSQPMNSDTPTTSCTDNPTLYTTINPATNIATNVTNINTNPSIAYPTQNGTTDENDMEESMISFVDKLRSKTSKITIVEKNHIKTEIELTSNELLILKLAVLHNNNTVNLMNRTDDIKNLINKGLLHVSENGCSLVVDKIVEVIIKTNTHKGGMVVADYDDEESQIDGNQKNQEDSQENQTHGEEDSQGSQEGQANGEENSQHNKKDNSQNNKKDNSQDKEQSDLSIHSTPRHCEEQSDVAIQKYTKKKHSKKHNSKDDSIDDANEIIEKELSSDDYNRNVQSFEWEIDCCMDKEVNRNN